MFNNKSNGIVLKVCYCSLLSQDFKGYFSDKSKIVLVLKRGFENKRSVLNVSLSYA